MRPLGDLPLAAFEAQDQQATVRSVATGLDQPGMGRSRAGQVAGRFLCAWSLRGWWQATLPSAVERRGGRRCADGARRSAMDRNDIRHDARALVAPGLNIREILPGTTGWGGALSTRRGSPYRLETPSPRRSG